MIEVPFFIEMSAWCFLLASFSLAEGFACTLGVALVRERLAEGDDVKKDGFRATLIAAILMNAIMLSIVALIIISSGITASVGLSVFLLFAGSIGLALYRKDLAACEPLTPGC